MDENSGNSTDKRNWRERLGIGKGAANPDMPKIAEDFKAGGTAQRAEPGAPAAAPAPAPKPGMARPAAPLAPRPAGAPMAPRPAARPGSTAPPTAPPGVPAGSAKPAAPRVPPMASDALANKLRDQREAAEKLAVQRVQAAKQRAQTATQPGASQAGATPGAKPKFSFADEDRGGPSSPSVLPSLPPRTPAQPGAAPLPQRGAAPPVQTETARPAPVNPMAQPPAVPAFSPQQPPAFAPQMQPPRPQIGTPPSFAGQQGFSRPAPNTYPPPPPFQPPFQAPYPGPGYGPQPPAYRPVEPGGFAVPPGRGGYGVPPPPGPSRGPVPGRPAFQHALPPGPKLSAPGRGPQMAIGPAVDSDAEADDVFEPTPVRAPRRATANEYQQAYRDEMAYDDEPPRSRGLGMILGLVLLGLLVAFGIVFGYSRLVKTSHVTTTGGVPVVAAPASAPKAVPDATPAGQTPDTGKKQIYDRIEGDHEVPGGALKTNEETPQQPLGALPQPGTGTTPGSGTDGTPLPLPPPPGNGTGQQGAIPSDSKTDIASNTPAAGQSPAANSSVSTTSNQQTASTSGTVAQNSNGSPASASASVPNPATTAGIAPAGLPAPALDNTAAKGSESVVSGTPAAKPAKSADPLKQLVLGNKAGKSLGSRPVVLVPPAKTAPPLQTASSVAPAVQQSAPPATASGNGLYGDAPTTPIASPPALKSSNPVVASAPAPAKPSLALPTTGAFVAQLASFNSKAEASAEYQRLAAKHGAIITRYAPLIETAQVAGATRYRLNLGPMASNDAATSVCSSLISAGERDCVVRRQ